MNNDISDYKISDIEIGLKKQFKITMSELIVDDFAKLSGDFNPLHTSNDYALKTKFGKKICHGMLLASYLSRLVGMYLPGKNSLYLSQKLNFPFPCYIDDEIIIEGKVISKSESANIITIETIINKMSGECVLKGTAKVMVRK